jgi:hypothetical protein
VAPIEVRPITAAGLDDLLAGRCPCSDCGDEVNVFEVDVLHGGWLPAGAPASAAHGRQDYCANVDGPWPRTWVEFQAVLGELVVMVAAVRELGQDGVLAARMGAFAQYVTGVRWASGWTLGMWESSPLRDVAEPVSDASIAAVIAEVDRVTAVTPGLASLGAGVRAWLEWITGDRVGLAYPPAVR